MANSYPFTWAPISDEEKAARAKLWTGPATFNIDMVKSTPMNMYMPAKFPEIGERIYNFKPRPDDVWIVTYPKCGTTLTQELMWQMANGANPDSEDSKKNVFLRVPFIEMTCLNTSSMPVPSVETDDPMNIMARMMADTVAWTDKQPSPRIIKTHLPMCMLPPNLLDVCKVLFVCRNVKDTCVSFYHHEKLLPNQGLDKDADFGEYSEFYRKGEVLYGSYWAHLKDGWKYKGNKNFKFMWYEDLRVNLDKCLRELADFTGFKLSDDNISTLVDHLNIENFRKNDAVNMKPMKGTVPDEVRDNFNFIRKGKVGDWKDHFKCEEKVKEWNQWIENNNDMGIPIKYEL